jgi:addiction module RelE/StbE family toxin
MRGKSTNRPEIKFLEPFDRQLKNAPDEIQEAFFGTLELFLADPHHSKLRNHELKKRFTGYRSIDVTEDWRAVFKETQTGEQRAIKFYILGTHTDLYRHGH